MSEKKRTKKDGENRDKQTARGRDRKNDQAQSVEKPKVHGDQQPGDSFDKDLKKTS